MKYYGIYVWIVGMILLSISSHEVILEINTNTIIMCCTGLLCMLFSSLFAKK